MAFSTNSNNPYSETENIKDLQDILVSGFYQFNVHSAFYKTGINKKNGKAWHSCQLICALKNVFTGEIGKASFSFFLPSSEMSQFCYICDQRLPDGNLGLPDPDHVSGTRQDGSTYDLSCFKCCENSTGFVLLESEGTGTRQDGSNYAQFKIVSFCNAQGIGAVDISKGCAEPSDVNRNFIALIQKQMEKTANTVQQASQIQQVAQPQQVAAQQMQTMQQQASQVQQAQALNPQATQMYGFNQAPVGGIPF